MNVVRGTQRMTRYEFLTWAEAQRMRYEFDGLEPVAMTVHTRANGNDPWTTTALTGGDVLSMPEIAAEIPVAELYEGTDLAEESAGDA